MKLVGAVPYHNELQLSSTAPNAELGPNNRVFSRDVTVGVPKQRSCGRVGALNYSSRNWPLFLCKRFLLFWLKNMLIDRVSENSIPFWRFYKNVSKNNISYEGTLDYLKCLFDSPIISNVLP